MLELIRSVHRQPLLLVLAAVLTAAATPAVPHAQTAAAPPVAGSVLDPDGKAVVEAAVIVRNEATRATSATVTDGRGHFSVSGLASGAYTVEIAVPGFEIVRRTGVQVTTIKPEDLTV